MGNQENQQDKKLRGFERQMAALHLRAAGANYEQIADKLGYASRSGAWRAVNSAMRKLKLEGATEARMLQIQRLDELLLGTWKRAKTGDPRAVRAALAILERQARLMGLDAPSKLEIGRLLESEDWLRARETIMTALKDFPEARSAIVKALRELED